MGERAGEGWVRRFWKERLAAMMHWVVCGREKERVGEGSDV